MKEFASVWLIIVAIAAILAIAAVTVGLIVRNKKRHAVVENEKRIAEQAEREAEKKKREDERCERERELAAAITAAVAAYLEAEADAEAEAPKGKRPSFRVVAFERVSGARPWNRRP